MPDYPDEPDDRFEDDRGYDNAGENRPDDERQMPARQVEKARRVTAIPGLFLILNGLFGLVIIALLAIPTILEPEMQIKWLKDLAAQQPPGPQRKQLEQVADDAQQEINANRTAHIAQNAGELFVAAVLNVLAIVGGLKMRSLSGYGMSLTGAIISLIPCLTGCCCTGVPFGIWALVVLMRPEVKAAYAARRLSSRTTNPDDEYML